eukprot:6962944-Prymnesium_polylepis.1
MSNGCICDQIAVVQANDMVAYARARDDDICPGSDAISCGPCDYCGVSRSLTNYWQCEVEAIADSLQEEVRSHRQYVAAKVAAELETLHPGWRDRQRDEAAPGAATCGTR